nr:2156_t:CDS:2 [Entrophospora candida]
MFFEIQISPQLTCDRVTVSALIVTLIHFKRMKEGNHHHHRDGESCSHGLQENPYSQSLDELDFQRSIHYACMLGDVVRLKTMISKKGGSIVNEIDSTGYSPLHYSALKGNFEICKILLDHGANVNVITPQLLSTPLHRASVNNHVKVVNLLLSYGAKPELQDSDGQTALHKACENNSKDVIEILKNFNQLLFIQDKKKQTPIDCCKVQETKLIFS